MNIRLTHVTYLANNTVLIQHLAPICMPPLTGSSLLNKAAMFHGGTALIGHTVSLTLS